MRSSWFAIAFLIVIFGCHHRRDERPKPVPAALRFYGWTQLVGPMRDTVVLQVSVKNAGRIPVPIAFSFSCGLRTHLTAASVGPAPSRKWSMAAWQRTDGPAPSSPFALQPVCGGGL